MLVATDRYAAEDALELVEAEYEELEPVLDAEDGAAADAPLLYGDWGYHIITPNPFTPGGYKGAGETGTVTPVPCLANAVEDALAPLGRRIDRMPLTPDRVWAQIHAEEI